MLNDRGGWPTPQRRLAIFGGHGRPLKPTLHVSVGSSSAGWDSLAAWAQCALSGPTAVILRPNGRDRWPLSANSRHAFRNHRRSTLRCQRRGARRIGHTIVFRLDRSQARIVLAPECVLPVFFEEVALRHV